MKNLLLTEAAYQKLQPNLALLLDQLTVVRLQLDGTLQVNGETTTSDQHPIHMTWFSLDIISNKQFGPFIKLITAAKELAWLQSVTAGLDAPFFKQVFDLGIRLTNSDAQAPAIAEYVVAAVLNRYQGFAERAQHQANNTWEGNYFREIHGSNWLIVGFGHIGQLVGKIAKGFDAQVTGVKRAAATAAHADQIITYAEMHQHLPKADVVVLACALTDTTRLLFNARTLGLMKPDAVLVNIARGGVVDEPALLAALDQDAIDYAILDVFAQEPLPAESPLWQHPRVLLTPHSSNRGLGTQPRGEQLFLANLEAFLAGKPLRNEVNHSYFQD